MNTFLIGKKENLVPVEQAYLNSKNINIVKDKDDAFFYTVVGGDGIILDKETKEICMERPVLRVHNSDGVKSLGFTCDVNLSNLKQAIEDIDNNLFSYERVNLLKYTINLNGAPKGYALNEVSIESVTRGRTVLLDTSIDVCGDIEKLPTPKCTGVLVTSNYGSTAWNASANGPILLKDKNSFGSLIINLREAPIIFSKYITQWNSVVTLKTCYDALVTADKDTFELPQGSSVSVSISDNHAISFIKTKNTEEKIMDKLLRYIKYQSERVNEE